MCRLIQNIVWPKPYAALSLPGEQGRSKAGRLSKTSPRNGRGWPPTSSGRKLRWKSSTRRVFGDRRPTRKTDPHFSRLSAAKNSSLGQKSACSLSPSRNQSRQAPSQSQSRQFARARTKASPVFTAARDRRLAPPSSRPSAPACAAPGRIAASEVVRLPSNPPSPRGRGFRLAAIVGYWRGGRRSKP